MNLSRLTRYTLRRTPLSSHGRRTPVAFNNSPSLSIYIYLSISFFVFFFDFKFIRLLLLSWWEKDFLYHMAFDVTTNRRLYFTDDVNRETISFTIAHISTGCPSLGEWLGIDSLESKAVKRMMHMRLLRLMRCLKRWYRHVVAQNKCPNGSTLIVLSFRILIFTIEWWKWFSGI